MIDKEIFLQQMALLADRIGRELSGPTQVEYHRQLSAALTNEQFVAAMTLAFRQWSGDYRTWPSPQQIVELIRPVAAPTLSAHEAFEQVLDVMNKPQLPINERRAAVQAMGASPLRAFIAAGGNREFIDVLEVDVPWLRKRFVEAYEHACANAEAEHEAMLAIGEADTRVQAMVSSIAAAKALPTKPQRRIAG